MLIIFGQRLYGKVDQLPGVLYVATMFMHIYFVPVAPYQTMVVIDRPYGKAVYGFRTRLSVRSILMAWLRCALVLSLFIFLPGALVGGYLWLDGQANPSINQVVVFSTGPFIVPSILWASFRLTHANVRRARLHAEVAGIDPDQVESYMTTGAKRPDISLLDLQTRALKIRV